MTSIETKGGVPTRGEAYLKLLHHIREAEDQAYIMSHLHNTEGNEADKALSRMWMMVGERLKVMAEQITNLASGRLNS